MQKFLAHKSIPVIIQPPYSPDLVPSEFWLFPTLKMGLCGTRFATMEDIKSNATAELRKIRKEAFRRCFQQWQDRWSKCVCAQGSYFEGDQVSVVVCTTITVLYHNSGNFLTAPRIQNLTTGNLIILCSVLRALIRCFKFLKEPTNALGFMNVILLHINHRHVSTTHIAIFRLIRTSIPIQL